MGLWSMPSNSTASSSHIRIGLDEGGRLVTGGPGRAEGFDRGFFCKPTVLADVTPDMTLAKEEIFGPVLVVMPYTDRG